MLQVTKMSIEHASVYLKVDDYRLGSEHPSLRSGFAGGLVKKLGLDQEPFSDVIYQAALRGEYRSGLRKKQKVSEFKAESGRKARAAYDCTFSAPKSVSIAALVLGDDRLAEAHHRAVEAAMAEVQRLACIKVTADGRRKSRHRQDLVPAESGIAWVPFVHTMSRLRVGKTKLAGGDPQLHTHVAVLNVAERDGQLHALDFGLVMRHVKSIGAIYRAELAKQVRALGYDITVSKKGGWEIAGISTDVLTKFSDGRTAIERHTAENPQLINDFGQSAAHQIANNETRASKKFDISPEDRLEWWRHKAAQRGIDLDQVAKDLQSSRLSKSTIKRHAAAGPIPAAQADTWVLDAVAALSERKSKFSPGEIAEAAALISKLRLAPQDVDASIARLEESGDLIRRKDGRTFTTRFLLDCEIAILSSYLDARSGFTPIQGDLQVFDGIARFQQKAGFELSRGQREAVHRILTSRDGVNVIVGDAGTGKSTSMAAVRELGAETGIRVVGMAPSSKARQALAESLGEENVIVSQRAIRDRRWWARNVDANTIVVVDEAGLVDARSMRKILELARDRGARVALVGDPKQYASVEAGSSLLQLVEAAKHEGVLVRLDQMQRAKTDVLKQLHLASRDDPKDSLRILAEHSMVWHSNREARRHMHIAKEFAALSAEERMHSLVLVGTNRDRVAIQEEVRRQLGLEGGIQVKSFEARDLTRAEMRHAHFYQVGDVVQAIQAVDGLKKREMATVVDRDEVANTVTLQREDGSRFDLKVGTEGASLKLGDLETVEVAKGEIVRFTGPIKIDEKTEIANGERASVLAVDEDAKTITICRIGRSEALTLPAKGLQLRHGYVVTGHSAQGHTMNKVGKLWMHVTTDDPTLSKNSWYTNVTRSTMHIELVTDAKTADQFATLGAKISREIEYDRALEDASELRAAADSKQKERAERDRIQVARTLAPRDGFWSPDGAEFVPYDSERSDAEQLVEVAKQFGDRVHLSGSDEFRRRMAALTLEFGMSADFVDRNGRRIQSELRASDTSALSSDGAPGEKGPKIVVQLPEDLSIIRRREPSITVRHTGTPVDIIDYMRRDQVVVRESESRVRLLAPEQRIDDVKVMLKVCSKKWSRGFQINGSDHFKREFCVAAVESKQHGLVKNAELQQLIASLVAARGTGGIGSGGMSGAARTEPTGGRTTLSEVPVAGTKPSTAKASQSLS